MLPGMLGALPVHVQDEVAVPELELQHVAYRHLDLLDEILPTP
jgi:hypothetical protein